MESRARGNQSFSGEARERERKQVEQSREKDSAIPQCFDQKLFTIQAEVFEINGQ